jgi:hypothetical protein
VKYTSRCTTASAPETLSAATTYFCNKISQFFVKNYFPSLRRIFYSFSINSLVNTRSRNYISLLPAFQVRVLTWTGESSSNPERAQGDKFLAVNGLNGNTAGGVRAVKALKSWSMRGTLINCQVGRSFTAPFFG